MQQIRWAGQIYSSNTPPLFGGGNPRPNDIFLGGDPLFLLLALAIFDLRDMEPPGSATPSLEPQPAP